MGAGAAAECDTPEVRFFNTTGPIVPADHYYVPPLERLRLGHVLTLVRDKRYFVLHAPRQTGKTTALLVLRNLLNEGECGDFRASCGPATWTGPRTFPTASSSAASATCATTASTRAPRGRSSSAAAPSTSRQSPCVSETSLSRRCVLFWTSTRTKPGRCSRRRRWRWSGGRPRASPGSSTRSRTGRVPATTKAATGRVR